MSLANEKPGCFIGSPILVDELVDISGAFNLSSFDSIRHRRSVHAKVPLYLEGDSPREIYVLVSGSVEIRQSIGDRYLPMRNAMLGEILGVRESISRNKIGYDIVTTSECIIDVISRRDFIRFVRSDCKVCFKLLKTIGKDLQTSYKSFISCPETHPIM